MTDGAALPMALSRLVPEIKSRAGCMRPITAGQAFGGDFEAVNLYSALAAAKEAAHADIIVAGPGPGAVGTATPLGFSGLDQGLAINAAASLRRRADRCAAHQLHRQPKPPSRPQPSHHNGPARKSRELRPWSRCPACRRSSAAW